jgi:hypothetical protein
VSHQCLPRFLIVLNSHLTAMKTEDQLGGRGLDTSKLHSLFLPGSGVISLCWGSFLVGADPAASAWSGAADPQVTASSLVKFPSRTRSNSRIKQQIPGKRRSRRGGQAWRSLSHRVGSCPACLSQTAKAELGRTWESPHLFSSPFPSPSFTGSFLGYFTHCKLHPFVYNAVSFAFSQLWDHHHNPVLFLWGWGEYWSLNSGLGTC